MGHSKVKIETDNAGKGTIAIGDLDLENVYGYEVTHKAGTLPRIKVELSHLAYHFLSEKSVVEFETRLGEFGDDHLQTIYQTIKIELEKRGLV